MITNKDVTAKRKEGALDEAYQMALLLMSAPRVDEWDFKAFGWCLIALIKRDVEANDRQDLARYCEQLLTIKVDPKDEILQKSIKNALSLCHPQGHLINQAKSLSKQKQHANAATLYRQVLANGSADIETQTSLGWELYLDAKQLMALENINLGAVKRNLNEYLKLEIEKPSLLHSCILQIASKLAGEDKFKMLVFSKMWNLDYLRQEDFDRYHADDGKEYPSLAEKIIQQVSKEAVVSESAQELNYILPHIDSAIEKFPDNIWLKLNKAKVLLGLRRNDDALTFGLEVIKSKRDDYWAWNLLGDICAGTDAELAVSCYCKALLCPTDDKFTGNVRLKLAQRMVHANNLVAAKHEVVRVLEYKQKEGQRIPDVAASIASEAWYAGTLASTSNMDYYKANVLAAEALVFSKMPWISATVGEEFTVPASEERKAKIWRRIFIKTSSIPMEVSIPASKFKYRNLVPGDGLRIKGEFDSDKRFQIYLVESRSADERWDIFSELIGIVSRVKKDSNEVHFIVDRYINGVVRDANLTTALKEGDAIAVKISSSSTKKGQMFRAIHAVVTDQVPSLLLKKQFSEEVRVSNGMGFTANDIFIPPTLVNEYQIEDGQEITGIAVLNYNKKKENWGWKAISIEI